MKLYDYIENPIIQFLVCKDFMPKAMFPGSNICFMANMDSVSKDSVTY